MCWCHMCLNVLTTTARDGRPDRVLASKTYFDSIRKNEAAKEGKGWRSDTGAAAKAASARFDKRHCERESAASEASI